MKYSLSVVVFRALNRTLISHWLVYVYFFYDELNSVMFCNGFTLVAGSEGGSIEAEIQ